MPKIPLIAWIFMGIPESIALLYLSCKLLDYKFDNKTKRKKLIILSIIYGLCAYLIRFLPIAQGVHSVVLLAVLAFVTIYCIKCKPQYGIITSTVVFIILTIYETICVIFISSLLNLDTNSLSTDAYIFLGFPQISFLFITGIVVDKLYDIKRKAKLAK